MFNCDNCAGWFHPECLGMTKEEIKNCDEKGEQEKWFHSEDCKAEFVLFLLIYSLNNCEDEKMRE